MTKKLLLFSLALCLCFATARVAHLRAQEPLGRHVVSPALLGQTKAMMNKYGLYGKLQAQPGKGPELGEILLQAAKLMENAKGCLLYIVNKNPETPDAVYVIEVWESKEAHDESLKLPAVRELISRGMPLIAGKPEGITLEVLGGKGLS